MSELDEDCLCYFFMYIQNHVCVIIKNYIKKFVFAFKFCKIDIYNNEEKKKTIACPVLWIVL